MRGKATRWVKGPVSGQLLSEVLSDNANQVLRCSHTHTSLLVCWKALWISLPCYQRPSEVPPKAPNRLLRFGAGKDCQSLRVQQPTPCLTVSSSGCSGFLDSHACIKSPPPTLVPDSTKGSLTKASCSCFSRPYMGKGRRLREPDRGGAVTTWLPSKSELLNSEGII